jgi:hypothetical protein
MPALALRLRVTMRDGLSAPSTMPISAAVAISVLAKAVQAGRKGGEEHV